MKICRGIFRYSRLSIPKGWFCDRSWASHSYLRRILCLLRRVECVLLLAPRRTVRLVLADFVRTVRLSLRRTGFTLALVAFFAAWPSAATCPSVEPIFSATVTKTCFSLSTKLALFICSPNGSFCLPTPQLSWLVCMRRYLGQRRLARVL
jgi:hypothetical protein